MCSQPYDSLTLGCPSLLVVAEMWGQLHTLPDTSIEVRLGSRKSTLGLTFPFAPPTLPPEQNLLNPCLALLLPTHSHKEPRPTQGTSDDPQPHLLYFNITFSLSLWAGWAGELPGRLLGAPPLLSLPPDCSISCSTPSVSLLFLRMPVCAPVLIILYQIPRLPRSQLTLINLGINCHLTVLRNVSNNSLTLGCPSLLVVAEMWGQLQALPDTS